MFAKEKVAIDKVIQFRFSRQLDRRLTNLIEKEFGKRNKSVKTKAIMSFESTKLLNTIQGGKNTPLAIRSDIG